MTNKRLRFKGECMLAIGKGAKNAHQLALRSRVSYPTILRYITMPHEIQAYDAMVLPAILIDGQGIAPEELLNMRLGDLFDLVDVK